MTTLAVPLATLAGRRLRLTARTPRELLVPLLTPVMFALVIAPALKQALHASAGYESLVAVGTIGLLIPLNTMCAGLGVIVDREAGAQRELLAAPIHRSLLVLGNLLVALGVTALQVATLIVVALARGIDLHTTSTGLVWFVAAATCSRWGCSAPRRRSRAGSGSRRSTSPASRRSRSSPGSSQVRCSRSRPGPSS